MCVSVIWLDFLNVQLLFTGIWSPLEWLKFAKIREAILPFSLFG